MSQTLKRVRDAKECLNYAFAMEAKTIQPQGLRDEVGSGTNMADRIAEGIMLKNFCLRHLGVRGKQIVGAIYTVPAGRTLIDRKKYYMEILSKWLYSETHRDRWLMLDVVREYCGELPAHDYVWWARHLEKPPRTIHRWCKSKNPADRSAWSLLTEWENGAMERVQIALEEEGIL